MLTPHGYAAYAVGKWHLTPEDEEHLGARRDRWPLGQGFERWYGFFPGETHQFVPALVHDSHHVEPPAGVDDGYHLTDRPGRPLDRVRRGPAQRRRRQAVVPLPGHRRLPLAPPDPAGVGRALPGPLRPGLGRVAGGRAGPPEGGGPAARRTPSCRPGPTGCRRGTRCPTSSSRVYARYMEAFAAFLSHTDHELGRLVDRLEAMGELDDTVIVVLSDNGASSEGGAGRVAQRRPGVERAAPHRGGGRRAHRRDRRAPHPQQLPVGVDRRRQHAVPPLEARDPRGRRRRPADRPLAQRDRRRRGEVRSPVRPRHRPRCRPCST